jgi:hypothetical protein
MVIVFLGGRLKKKGKSEWLCRTLIACPYFCLCLTEDDYNRKLDKLKISKSKREPFVTTNTAAAQVHYYENKEKETVCFVTLADYKKRSICAIFALIVHEVMHIWREQREIMNEGKPSNEFEAYSIQAICLELFDSFCRQTGRKELFEKQRTKK